MNLPGTTPMPLIPIGITVAALAEAMQVHAANEPADRIREPWGQAAEYVARLSRLCASSARNYVLIGEGAADHLVPGAPSSAAS